MADNVTLPASSGKCASDEVTYSGDTNANVQIFRLVSVTGAEGSKTVVESSHDGAAANYNPILVGGIASAAAPSDVSSDNDAVRAWFLRNGAQAMVVTAAGALDGGDATNGLDVDVTRMKPDGTNTMPSMD